MRDQVKCGPLRARHRTLFFTLFAIVATVLLALPWHTANAGAPLFQAGFYEATPSNTIFGKLLHLHQQDLLDSNNKIRKGIHGNFNDKGKIFTNAKENGRLSVRWEQVLENYRSEGTAQIYIMDSENLYFSAKEKDRTHLLQLKFIGNTLPEDGKKSLRTKFIAHRGFSYFPPYNSESIYPAGSMPAFTAALDAGYQGFEFDLRVSSDGKFIVSHDEKLSISTDCTGKVHEKTIEELLNCTVIASTVIPEASSVRAPTSAKMSSLRQVLENYASDARLKNMVLDIKPNSDANLTQAYAEALLPFLNNPDFLRKLLIIAQSENAIQEMKRVNPWSQYALEGGSTGLEPATPETQAQFIPEASQNARQAHDMVSLNLGLGFYVPPILGMFAMRDTVDLAHKYNYPVLGWTVNTPAELASIRNYFSQLDYLISDAPMDYLISNQVDSTVNIVAKN